MEVLFGGLRGNYNIFLQTWRERLLEDGYRECEELGRGVDVVEILLRSPSVMAASSASIRNIRTTLSLQSGDSLNFLERHIKPRFAFTWATLLSLIETVVTITQATFYGLSALFYRFENNKANEKAQLLALQALACLDIATGTLFGIVSPKYGMQATAHSLCSLFTWIPSNQKRQLKCNLVKAIDSFVLRTLNENPVEFARVAITAAIAVGQPTVESAAMFASILILFYRSFPPNTSESEEINLHRYEWLHELISRDFTQAQGTGNERAFLESAQLEAARITRIFDENLRLVREDVRAHLRDLINNAFSKSPLNSQNIDDFPAEPWASSLLSLITVHALIIQPQDQRIPIPHFVKPQISQEVLERLHTTYAALATTGRAQFNDEWIRVIEDIVYGTDRTVEHFLIKELKRYAGQIATENRRLVTATLQALSSHS